MFRKKQIVEKRTVLFVDDDEAILRSLESSEKNIPTSPGWYSRDMSWIPNCRMQLHRESFSG